MERTTPLTDRQLEIAARKHCELTGLDPDQSVPHHADAGLNGITHDMLCYSPLWERVARSIKKQDLIEVSIRHALIRTDITPPVRIPLSPPGKE